MRLCHISTSVLPSAPRPNNVRFRVQLLEIAADGDGFGDDGAVVEFEHRQALQRVARTDWLLSVLQRAHVDGHQRNLKPFFGKEDANPPWIGRPAAVEEFHSISPIGSAQKRDRFPESTMRI